MPPAILWSQDRSFLSRKAIAEESISRGRLAQRIPEETPATGGEEEALSKMVQHFLCTA